MTRTDKEKNKKNHGFPQGITGYQDTKTFTKLCRFLLDHVQTSTSFNLGTLNSLCEFSRVDTQKF